MVGLYLHECSKITFQQIYPLLHLVTRVFLSSGTSEDFVQAKAPGVGPLNSPVSWDSPVIRSLCGISQEQANGFTNGT